MVKNTMPKIARCPGQNLMGLTDILNESSARHCHRRPGGSRGLQMSPTASTIPIFDAGLCWIPFLNTWVPLKKAFRIKTSQLAWHCPAGRPDVEAWRRSRFDMSRRIDNTNFRCCLCVPSDLCSRTIYDNSKAVVSRCDADPRATSLLKKMLNKRLGLCRTGRANSRNTSTRATSTKQKATCEGKHSMFCVMKYW